MTHSETLSPLMGEVANKLFGEPSQSSRNGSTYRWGNRGSLKIEIDEGVWHDKEANEGGGVLSTMLPMPWRAT